MIASNRMAQRDLRFSKRRGTKGTTLVSLACEDALRVTLLRIYPCRGKPIVLQKPVPKSIISVYPHSLHCFSNVYFFENIDGTGENVGNKHFHPAQYRVPTYQPFSRAVSFYEFESNTISGWLNRMV